MEKSNFIFWWQNQAGMYHYQL